MIGRIVLAVVVGAAVGLLCLLLGMLLGAVGIPFVATVGSFLSTWAWVIGILAGLWWFFSGRTALF